DDRVVEIEGGAALANGERRGPDAHEIAQAGHARPVRSEEATAQRGSSARGEAQAIGSVSKNQEAVREARQRRGAEAHQGGVGRPIQGAPARAAERALSTR